MGFYHANDLISADQEILELLVKLHIPASVSRFDVGVHDSILSLFLFFFFLQDQIYQIVFPNCLLAYWHQKMQNKRILFNSGEIKLY